MNESMKGSAGAVEYAHRQTEPRNKYLSARSLDHATLEHAPSSWSDPVNAGFPRVGEEIHIDLGRGRALVLKYKGIDENDDLIFKWVGTVS